MAVKKITKKAAKKKHPVKKSPPKLRKITFDDLAAIFAETDARIAKSREETEALMAKSREETDKALREAVNKLSDENRKTSVLVRELTQNMGGLNNSFGYLVELVVVPKLRTAMNAAGGHTFSVEKVLVDKEFSVIIDGEKKPIGEIDMFLFSDTEAMVAEIKAQLQEHHVEKQLNRLQKLRNHEEKADIVGKKLFGAVVGVYIDPRAKALALENGLYVVEIREEEEKLNIEKPEMCRTW